MAVRLFDSPATDLLLYNRRSMNLCSPPKHLVGVESKRALVTKSRFEIGEDGERAYLEFEIDASGWMTIWHTEVPPALRGRGIASMLARTAFDYAQQNHLRVDVICPSALQFLSQHPEYKALIGGEKH